MDGIGSGGTGEYRSQIPAHCSQSLAVQSEATAHDLPHTAPHVLSNTNHDALLGYSYQLYDLLQQPSGPLPRPEFAHDVYRTQLLPLLNSLRTLRRGDVATLLLLACVYHALGDYRPSIDVSHEILAINPDCVSLTLRQS